MTEPLAQRLDDLEKLHGVLLEAYLVITRGVPLVANLKPDTAFGLGEAAGTIAKAKSLVGRDIDDMRTRSG